MEIWKGVNGYEDKYYVSNMGQVKNNDGKILTQEKTKKGYRRVALWKNNRVKILLYMDLF